MDAGKDIETGVVSVKFWLFQVIQASNVAIAPVPRTAPLEGGFEPGGSREPYTHVNLTNTLVLWRRECHLRKITDSIQERHREELTSARANKCGP